VNQLYKIKPEIIYITGYGRSGSTLLDILLSQHSNIFGGGELFYALDIISDEDGLCSCGERVSTCKVWNSIAGKISQWVDQRGITINHLRQLQKKVEPRSALINVLLRRNWSQLKDDEFQLYDAFQNFFFNELARHHNSVRYIVDASKSAARAANRVLALKQVAGLPVRVIHLVRDPRGVINSAQKGKNKDLEKGVKSKGKFLPMRAIIGWILANIIEAINSKLKDPNNIMVIKYEDLVHHPRKTLKIICKFIEIDPEPILNTLGPAHLPVRGHSIGGNRMRLGKVKVDPRKSESKIPWYYHLVCIMLCWPLMRRYGY
jgi:hypothetical protein